MRCLLVEDEPLARLRLEEYIRRIPFLSLCGAVDNGLDALVILQQEPIDLVFLDIEMDGITGLQLLEALPAPPAVVLTTAYDQYALRAFDLQVVDYLLKPYSFERFLQAVTRARQRTGKSPEEVLPSFLFVKTEYRLQKVAFEQILYIEGMRDYRRLHLTAEKIMTLETFSALEQRLPRPQFCRVHKSYLVALDKIESVERDRIYLGPVVLPISNTYRDEFYARIGRSSS
ncbi:LytR/AlgR family response regulator transcription factor [Larkinella soli]|uniref:LytR/AlgR family response regulator transcription factor n=1 Tax=Larkinella soli TaxID=1770527 RepID=UPI000FFC4B08|nr:LytTR family DNA-binding domain-containing protein [Larkinella soli]